MGEKCGGEGRTKIAVLSLAQNCPDPGHRGSFKARAISNSRISLRGRVSYEIRKSSAARPHTTLRKTIANLFDLNRHAN